MCCKVARVAEVQKAAGEWCSHCAPGRVGCTIYESRPPVCRDFHCLWLSTPELGPEWRPLTCKMVVLRAAHRIIVMVDPGHPAAWRAQPYYKQLKDWARAGVDAQPRQQVLVYLKTRVIVVLPNKEVDLGPLATDDHSGDYIMVRELKVPHGRDWEAYVLPAKGASSELAGARDLVGS